MRVWRSGRRTPREALADDGVMAMAFSRIGDPPPLYTPYISAQPIQHRPRLLSVVFIGYSRTSIFSEWSVLLTFTSSAGWRSSISGHAVLVTQVSVKARNCWPLRARK